MFFLITDFFINFLSSQDYNQNLQSLDWAASCAQEIFTTQADSHDGEIHSFTQRDVELVWIALTLI